MSARRSIRVADGLDRLAEGELVAFPTETLWGLAALAMREPAVARLLAWKGRAESNPLPLLVSGREALLDHVPELPESAERLVDALWPGPVTLIVHSATRFAPGVAGPGGAVGFRCSPHPVAALLVRGAEAAGLGPITVTSLNRSGAAPASVRAEAEIECAGSGAPTLLDPGPDAGGGAPSTVVDCTGALPRIVREGAIRAEEVLRLAGSA